MKIKKILVPIDGSDYSTQAAAYAANLAGLIGAEILLLHCHKPFPVVLGEPYFQNAISKIMKKSNNGLSLLENFFRRPGSLLRIGFLKGLLRIRFVKLPK